MVVAVHLLKSHREAKRSHSWKHSNIGKPSEPSAKVDTISDIPFSNVTTGGCKSIKHRAMKGEHHMYRQYEDARALTKQLEAKKRAYEEAKKANVPIDELWDMSEDIGELEERINFAWQDEEYD